MTDSDKKPKLQIPTRTAKPKGDMFANLRKPEQVETIHIEELLDQPPRSQPYDSQPPEPPLPGHGSQPSRSQPEAAEEPHRSQPQYSQPLRSQLNMLAALPDVKGHLELPHQIGDHLLRHLTPYEQVVYLQLYRLAWGHKSDKCFISNPSLADRANISVAKVKMVTKELEAKGLIEKIARPHGSKLDQGIHYKVHAPSWQLQRNQLSHSQPRGSQPQYDPNKENSLKETTKEFDASLCPDCQGTGFYYPEGTEKGVKRCTHARLARPEQ